MRLFNIYKRIRTLFWRLSDVDKQWQYHDQRKASIMWLSLQGWYNTIVEYREIEANTAMNKLCNKDTPISEISYWQARHNSAISFLDFLDNMRS